MQENLAKMQIRMSSAINSMKENNSKVDSNVINIDPTPKRTPSRSLGYEKEQMNPPKGTQEENGNNRQLHQPKVADTTKVTSVPLRVLNNGPGDWLWDLVGNV